MDDRIADLMIRIEDAVGQRDAAVARAEAAEARLYELENAITWDTTCLNCSKLLDQCYAETARAEAAEQAVQRVRDTVAEHRISFQPGAVIQISHIEAALDVTCCDLHNRNCEPPSELCCGGCTERNHPNHPPGERCVMATLDGTP